MITWSKFHSVSYDSIKRRILKVFEFGAKTANECAAFGDDSNPVQGMDAIYATTTNESEPIIIGYINRNQLALAGEKRLYSIKADGKTQSFYVWLKNNGTMEIGGNNDNLVRYAALNQALQNQLTSLNAELVKIQAGLVTVGGSYAMVPLSLNISASKINEIKCI